MTLRILNKNTPKLSELLVNTSFKVENITVGGMVRNLKKV